VIKCSVPVFDPRQPSSGLPQAHYVTITLPRGLSYEIFSEPALPGWDSMPANASKAFGERWCQEKSSAILLVPSVVARVDRNMLINPA
ncbi:RES family NAD+ phosphorylase, partial [Rhizobium leguminosarum]|uniref:RES family NAD+ phosphorylase n=1 Tax=Rhizobium leguminosarum TaxID=384 RepID=UPI003F9623E7